MHLFVIRPRLAAALLLIGLSGCGSPEVGTIGPQTGADSPAPPPGAPVGRQGTDEGVVAEQTATPAGEGGGAAQAR